MYGIVTDDAALAPADVADVTFYVADHPHGDREEPLAEAVNSVACWGDTRLVEAEPDRAAMNEDGTRATTDLPDLHWGTVCPTDPAYREAMLDRIEEVGAVGDVRLTTVGFPDPSFCHCDRCESLFEASEHDDREPWRAEVVTTFVAEAAERAVGDLWVTLPPDPYPGNLRERRGIEPAALADHVDGFYVPLCSQRYETTYWVETLARGFETELEAHDVPLALHLSASDVDVDRFVELGRKIRPHGDLLVFNTARCEFDAVRSVVERLREDDAVPRAV